MLRVCLSDLRAQILRSPHIILYVYIECHPMPATANNGFPCLEKNRRSTNKSGFLGCQSSQVRRNFGKRWFKLCTWFWVCNILDVPFWIPCCFRITTVFLEMEGVFSFFLVSFLVPFWRPLMQRMGGTQCVYIYHYVSLYRYIKFVIYKCRKWRCTLWNFMFLWGQFEHLGTQPRPGFPVGQLQRWISQFSWSLDVLFVF